MSDTSGASDQGTFGQIGTSDYSSEHNGHYFGSRQQDARVRTHVAVAVKAVHPGQNGGPPTVDVQPLVKQMDGAGNASSHGMIYGIPVRREQAGDFAFINDPVVGDIGSMAVHDRDISSLVANNGQESSPGSFRKHSLADGVFLGPMLNQTTPNHKIEVKRDSTGNVTSLNISSTAMLNFNGVTIDPNGKITAPGDVIAGGGTGDQISLQQHVHPGTSPPTPGS